MPLNFVLNNLYMCSKSDMTKWRFDNLS